MKQYLLRSIELQKSYETNRYLVKHNVESEPEGHDEERIPKKEREEGLENLMNRFELWKNQTFKAGNIGLDCFEF